jgi:outer membrane protein assembly factor BamB
MSFHLSTAFLIAGIASVAAAQDWPQFLGPTRNGTYSGTNLAATWPKEGPSTLWKKDVGPGFSGPVAGGGKLILFHRVEDKETVECFEAATGQRTWLFDYVTTYRDDFGFDEGPRATPAVAKGHVYTYGAQGKLHCLDFASGRKLWSVDAQKDFGAKKGFFGIVCSPLVEGKLLLLNVGGSKAGIVAFDAETGAVTWKTSPADASYSSPTAVSIAGKRYAFFFTREGLTALEPASGKVWWEFPWRPAIDASVNAAAPLVIGDMIFVSTSYGRGAVLLHFDEQKPVPVWSGDDMLSNHYATSVHHHGFLFGYHGRQEHGCDLRCVELKTGKVMWSVERFGAGTVTVAGDDLLLLTEKGELIKAPATPKEFKPGSRAQILGFEVRAYPALADGLLFARSRKQLVGVDLRMH